MYLKRRNFLKLSSLATASLMVPRFLNAIARQEVPMNTQEKNNKILVVLQLSGGNDGLNTVIPVRNDLYYQLRPSLSIPKEKTLLLNDDTGLHPSLTTFKSLYDEGNLSILNNVGYPNPDRSHFRSMDIWQSASNSNEILQTGWLGRYLDAQCAGCDLPIQALEIDDTLSLALKGQMEKAIALKDPKLLYQNSQQEYLKNLTRAYQKESPQKHQEQPVDYLYKTMAETINSAAYLFDISKTNATPTAYPKTEIGKNLKTIASLILSGGKTQVYYLSIGSFDTHVNQKGQQEKLFLQINEAIKVFTDDLKANQRIDDVLLCTFSEFGRRVAQNASNGTDHGTANNMFFIGGGLKEKGLLNALPNLSELQDGDLQYKIDFKSVYATLLNKWLGADDRAVLGKQMEYLNFV